MSRFMIFPYTQNSAGAIALAEALGGQRILREGSSYKPKPDDVIINWGASDCHFQTALNANNSAVLNKLSFFNRLIGTGLTPPFASTMGSAVDGLTFPIFCRTELRGRDGAGIVIADNLGQLVQCDLYVQGVTKTSEYRVHIGRNPDGTFSIIGSQKKIVTAPTDGLDNRVWAGEGTRFVWTVSGAPVKLPKSVENVAFAAFEHFPELTFGAFDIIYDSGASQAYVLEINSAPTMTPETARRYASFFRQFAKDAPEVPETAAASTAAAPTEDMILLTVTVAPESITAEQIQQTLSLMNGVTSVTVS